MSKLDFPDNGRREPGRVHLQTVQAMRNANGDRKIAAKVLGISLSTLASRLHVIRGIRDAQK
jgi:hypothetical protein